MSHLASLSIEPGKSRNAEFEDRMSCSCLQAASGFRFYRMTGCVAEDLAGV